MTFDRELSDTHHPGEDRGEVISTLPSGEGGSDSSIDFDLLLGTHRSRDALEQAIAGIPVDLEAIPRKGAARRRRAPAPKTAQVGPFKAADADATGVAAAEAAQAVAAHDDFGP